MIASASIFRDGRESTEALWRAFAAPLRQFLVRRTRTPADAEDLLQEVFLRIHRQMPSLQNIERLEAWVYRIARNAVIDHYRTRRTTEPVDADSEVAVDNDAVVPADEASALASSLWRFIDALPPGYREPLVRHDFNHESMEAIASALGLSLTATKSRVRRARLMLREMLEACCRFEFDRRGRVIDAVPRRQPCPCP